MVLILLISLTFLEYPFEAGVGSFNRGQLRDDPLAIFHMPHLTPGMAKFSISLSNPYSIEGLKFGEFAISLNNLSIGAHYFGEEIYNEKTIALSLKSGLFGIYKASITLRFLELHIGDSRATRNVRVDLSVGESRRNIVWGAYIRNTLGSAKQAALSLGIYRKYVEVFADLTHLEGTPVNVSISLQVKPKDNFKIGIGVSQNPPLLSLSISLGKGGTELQYAYKYHLLLGGFSSIDFNQNMASTID